MSTTRRSTRSTARDEAGWCAPRYAPIAQSAEAPDLKSVQCGFESRWGHAPALSRTLTEEIREEGGLSVMSSGLCQRVGTARPGFNGRAGRRPSNRPSSPLAGTVPDDVRHQFWRTYVHQVDANGEAAMLGPVAKIMIALRRGRSQSA